MALAVVIGCAIVGHWGGLARLAERPGARSIAEVGLLPQFEPRSTEQFLGEHRLQLPAAGADPLPRHGDHLHHLAEPTKTWPS